MLLTAIVFIIISTILHASPIIDNTHNTVDTHTRLVLQYSCWLKFFAYGPKKLWLTKNKFRKVSA